MKNLTIQLRLASLLSLILLACMAAYGQLTPTGDSYTNTAASTTNYGTKTLLDLESTQTTFIQFNLESIPSGYTSADITKATLKLYVNTVPKAGSFNVDYVNGTWTESTIDASNAPALGTTIAASVPLTTTDKNQYILVDVTAAVQAWLSGTANDGIALVANSPLSATFDSKESTTTSHPPELDIVFAGGGSSGITGITTAAGSGLIGGGTSGTLNLSLTNACAAKQILQWTGSAWACASAGTGTITGVMAGTDLTGGGTSGNVTLSLNTTATNALYAQLGAANTFATNQTVDGTFTANSSGNSILGISTSAGGTGVAGLNIATTGGGAIGVLGQSSSTAGGIAVVGQTVGEDYYYFTNGAVGAEGGTNSPAGAGVWGLNTASTGLAMGVYGTSASTAGAGVYGSDSATTGTTYGVNGTIASNSGYGVYGQASSSTGSTYGVYGLSDSDAGFGVFGSSDFIGVVGEAGATGISTAGLPYGVVGLGPNVGVYGASSGVSGMAAFVTPAGIWGDYGGDTIGSGVLGTTDDSFAGAFVNNGIESTISVVNETTVAGVGAEVFAAYMPNLLANNAGAIIGDPGCGETSGNMGLQLGQEFMSGCTNYTLLGNNVGDTYLNAVSGQTLHLRIANSDVVKVATGSVSITGTLSATGTKNFRIDHPLDPANKYLTHAAIESSEVLNLYSGNTILDDSGAAVVQLPDWFEAINKDFRYQLTPIGAPGRDLYVAEEISGGHFKIAGGKAGGKVSWQVTGLRNDAWEKAYPMVVEADKGADRGHYLTPELYGLPATERIGYEAVPEGQPIVHHQRPDLLRRNASPAKTITFPAPPKLVLPKAASLHHAAARANKPEVNQK
jgi:trimeric autotransporter adhesin